MLDQVLSQCDADFDLHLDRLTRYIRQPSVSAENRGMTEMAELIAAEINTMGGVGKVVPAKEFPIVYGRFDVGAPRTILLHSMYDTTPANEAGWIVPPFEARRLDFEDLGDCIVARGTEDTKGPLTALMNAVAAYHRAGVKLPCNIIMVFEASELGSGSLPGFIREHADELRVADVCYWPLNTQKPDGTQVVALRVKGMVTFKLRCRGGAWGGPGRGAEIHGSQSTWVANPAHRLIAALVSMKTADDNDVAIEGFYEGRLPPTPGDEELVKKLVASLNVKQVLGELGVARFKQDDVERALRARFFQAEFNVSGLKAGYVNEEGHKMIVPHEAVAAVDMRAVDGMTTENMLASMRRHLDQHGYSDITIEVRNSYLGGGSPPEDWAVQELLQTYRDCGIEPQVWPCDPAAIAAKQFTDLGMSWIASMPGNANRRHSANEYIQVEGYKRAIAFAARLFWRLGHATPH